LHSITFIQTINKLNQEILYSLAALFLFAWIFQAVHYLYIMAAFNRVKPQTPNPSPPPVSVVICAKNEAENLRNFLPLILNQNYHNFQVIVVNDCSTDDTELVLAKLKRTNQNLYYTSIPVDKKFFHGKKLALTIGIKAAKHEHVVLTDADCYPTSDRWLQNMASSFTPDKKIILGYGAYRKEKGFLNLLIRYETFWNAVQYFGFASTFKPFMGVGRNIAYEKQLFNDSSQFKNNLTVASGDDDLFLVEMAKPANTTICFSPENHTLSVPSATYRDWESQKSRHLTSSVFYPFFVKGWLFFEFLTRQILWVFTFCSIIFSIFTPIIGVLFALHILIKLIVLNISGKKLAEKQLFWAMLLFDWLIPIWIGALWISNLLRPKKNRWK